MEGYRYGIRLHLLSVTLDSRPSVPNDGPKGEKTKVSGFIDLRLYEGVRSNSVWTFCFPQSNT